MEIVRRTRGWIRPWFALTAVILIVAGVLAMQYAVRWGFPGAQADGIARVWPQRIVGATAHEAGHAMPKISAEGKAQPGSGSASTKSGMCRDSTSEIGTKVRQHAPHPFLQLILRP